MNKKDLFEILKNYYKSEKTVYAILSGKRRPSYEKLILLNKQHNIPFTAWQNIRQYISQSQSPTDGS